MNDEDRIYFQRRVEEELHLAQRGSNTSAVRAHYELLGHYLDRLYPPDHHAGPGRRRAAPAD